MPYDTSFIRDVYECVFSAAGSSFDDEDIKLMHYLKAISDKIAFRNAVHEFIKRDGATIERMGRKAAEFRLSCFYQGINWRINYNKLIATLSKNNKGELVHPLLGVISVACDLLEGSTTFGSGRDLVEFTLTFTEDRVGTALGREEEPKVLQWLSQSSSLVALAMDLAKKAFAQAVPIISGLVGSVSAYTTSAEQALSDPVFASQLPTLLDAVGRSANLSIAAVLADPAVAYEADAYDTINAIESGHAAALTAYSDIISQVALPVERQVVISAPLITICQNWYPGADALRYSEIIEQLNPALPDVTWVQQGTRLLIPPPTLGPA